MTHVVLVGCGKMGGALLAGWHKSYAGRMEFSVITPSAPPALLERVSYYSNLDDLPQAVTPDVIVLAVKPQQLDNVLPAFAKRFANTNILYLSVAAGKTVDFYKSHLGKDAQVIRSMPNTPSLIGQGMTVLYAPADVPAPMQETANTLMAAVGDIASIHDEAQMDAAAAISGSGPAYLFYFIDCLAQAGISAGLDESLSRLLALRTAFGAAALANTGMENCEQLRKNVTSPNGMTEAALRVLMAQDGLELLLKNAVEAAKKRSIELKS